MRFRDLVDRMTGLFRRRSPNILRRSSRNIPGMPPEAPLPERDVAYMNRMRLQGFRYCWTTLSSGSQGKAETPAGDRREFPARSADPLFHVKRFGTLFRRKPSDRRVRASVSHLSDL